MIPQKVYMALLKKGWTPKRVGGGTQTLDFAKMQNYWHLTFDKHEFFVAKMPQAQAIKILKRGTQWNFIYTAIKNIHFCLIG